MKMTLFDDVMMNSMASHKYKFNQCKKKSSNLQYLGHFSIYTVQFWIGLLGGKGTLSSKGLGLLAQPTSWSLLGLIWSCSTSCVSGRASREHGCVHLPVLSKLSSPFHLTLIEHKCILGPLCQRHELSVNHVKRSTARCPLDRPRELLLLEGFRPFLYELPTRLIDCLSPSLLEPPSADILS